MSATTTLSSILYAQRRLSNEIELFGSLPRTQQQLTPEQKRRRDDAWQRRMARELAGEDPINDKAA
ncbi:hypothetical protein [Chromobacterium subtsugae]|uniref:hypothetical protein n=1 Tax=Chromobacterium subtsugae TaxID=251747 RepID=UPI0007F9105C|nr:hypothetical protein [Chromobacterium subtsugae]OBU85842.1 hypothetical protein MY55_13475 [Chromobacterium subtsugae]